jgi:CheY-like chemotaxis protein
MEPLRAVKGQWMIPRGKTKKARDKTKKLVLIVEDDAQIAKEIERILLKRYQESIDVAIAGDAGESLEWIDGPRRRPAALILDFMMPYGDARNKLCEAPMDPYELDTGLNLLSYLRKEEAAKKVPPVAVFITTARSALAVGARAKELVGEHGKIFYKPFSTLDLEEELGRALGITGKAPGEAH